MAFTLSMMKLAYILSLPPQYVFQPTVQPATLKDDSACWRCLQKAEIATPIIHAHDYFLSFPHGWQHYLLGGVREATAVPAWQLLVGGFFVGYGARLGNGCTSGHGICGLRSLQLPSLLAVLTFMATAFLTANLAARWLA